MKIIRILTVGIALMISVSEPVYAGSTESEATKLLKARSAEFRKEIILVADNIYTAVGYGVSPVSIIIGEKGLVIVDTGIDVSLGKEIRDDIRKITDKEVKAIIFTHGHGDHTTGAAAFMDSPDVQVWAREGYGIEGRFAAEAGLMIQKQRGAKQGGFLLPREQRINNGVARAYYPSRSGEVFGAGEVVPTHFLDQDRLQVNLAGVDLELVAATGETQDQLYVWYPEQRALFAGDNFYKSWPNLYPIRGAAYRDSRLWGVAVDKMLQEKPVRLIGGHTRPIVGEQEIATTLTNYRDAIRFVFDKTIEGMNKGLTPDQLVEYVQLPDKYLNLDYLKPYYGNPEWAVRSIFNGYLGWFDGNSTNLFPLSGKEEAQRIAKLAGGKKKLEKAARKALKSGDAQWAAQLGDHLLALDATDKNAMLIKADALTRLAEELLTATGRNYYLFDAQHLRKRANEGDSRN